MIDLDGWDKENWSEIIHHKCTPTINKQRRISVIKYLISRNPVQESSPLLWDWVRAIGGHINKWTWEEVD
jgi:hypothetical protein